MRGPAHKPLRILVVDDNEDTAMNLSFLFRSWNHEVHSAHDGPSALEEARQFRPDVVILDIGLPILDGFEVARQLRAMPQLGHVLIIGASGYNTAKDRRRATEVGIDYYMAKPFDPWSLETIFASHPVAATISA